MPTRWSCRDDGPGGYYEPREDAEGEWVQYDEVVALERDAARYRWLRANPAFETEMFLSGLKPEEFDKVVDEMRQSSDSATRVSCEKCLRADGCAKGACLHGIL